MTIDPDSTVASMFEAHFISSRPKSVVRGDNAPGLPVPQVEPRRT